MTLEERLWKTFNKALGQYQLIDEDDKILVGLSGGKDSLCLLEFLARRSKINVPHFTVEALHVRMENVHYETDTSYLHSFCARLGIPLHLITTHFAPSGSTTSPAPSGSTTSPAPSGSTTSPAPSGSPAGEATTPVGSPAPNGSPAGEATTPVGSPAPSGSPAGEATTPVGSPTGKKPPCFLCSWQRRKQLFNLAQQLGCTKIALGHHQDDIIHTALMNLTFQGQFSTMPVKLKMKKMPLTIIRPLCLCRETDIQAYARQQQYEQQIKRCPYEDTTNRKQSEALFARLEELNPEARYSIWHALENAQKLIEY